MICEHSYALLIARFLQGNRRVMADIWQGIEPAIVEKVDKGLDDTQKRRRKKKKRRKDETEEERAERRRRRRERRRTAAQLADTTSNDVLRETENLKGDEERERGRESKRRSRRATSRVLGSVVTNESESVTPIEQGKIAVDEIYYGYCF